VLRTARACEAALLRDLYVARVSQRPALDTELLILNQITQRTANLGLPQTRRFVVPARRSVGPTKLTLVHLLVMLLWQPSTGLWTLLRSHRQSAGRSVVGWLWPRNREVVFRAGIPGGKRLRFRRLGRTALGVAIENRFAQIRDHCGPAKPIAACRGECLSRLVLTVSIVSNSASGYLREVRARSRMP